MPISPLILIMILAVILVVFLALFIFRGQTSEERMWGDELKRLYAEQSGRRSSLVWRTQEEDDGSMRAYVMWMDGYVEIDPTRGIPTLDFDELAALEKEDGVFWRLPYEDGSSQMILSTSQTAFEEKLRELRSGGWEMRLVIPFSYRDRVVFLSQ